jgi:hypothetical protein
MGAIVAMLVTPAVIDWFDLGALRFRAEPTDMLIAVIGGLVQMLGLRPQPGDRVSVRTRPDHLGGYLMSNAKLTDQAKTFEVIAWIAVVTLSLQFLVFLKLLTLINPVSRRLQTAEIGLGSCGRRPAGAVARLVEVLPALIYLGGVLAAAHIFGRVAKGELFSRANSEGLAEVGVVPAVGRGRQRADRRPGSRAWIAGDHGLRALEGAAGRRGV